MKTRMDCRAAWFVDIAGIAVRAPVRRGVAMLAAALLLGGCAIDPGPVGVAGVGGYAVDISDQHIVRSMTSPGYPAVGSQAELFARAQACIVRTMRPNQSSASGAPLAFEISDVDAGTLVAGSRIELKTGYATARLEVDVRTGKFRLAFTELLWSKTEGDAAGSRLTPITVDAGAGKAAVKAMTVAGDQVAKCIQTAGGDW